MRELKTILTLVEEGGFATPQGSELLPLIENIEREYTSLRQRASYWARANGKQVKILSDGSRLAQTIRAEASAMEQGGQEIWQDLEVGADWERCLTSYEADIVITGSYLSAGVTPGVLTIPLLQQKGMTCA